jgi:hypothetical protein
MPSPTSRPRRRALLGCCLPLVLVLFGGSASAAESKPGSGIQWEGVPPADASKNSKYSAAGLRAAFQQVCRNIGCRLQWIEVDESKRPALVYGVIVGACDYKDIRRELLSMSDYTYNGAVTMVAKDGSKTAFAVDIIPRDRTAGGSGRESVMERLKALMMGAIKR